ncbi:NADH dehydrogenase [ubiquinone] 1 beta subcomplex subunit 10-like [Physella acuta]|uniref:NADH dehydrogenase [ubiquinone] 1 beta subcomplex subunit 10-like n=1 Tax=Physella acuta TaxID=109671 RepID=UPI0027DE6C07|nr:NADH dehydrogenase [ubiquinone] 1 beta subcomplex subunit 10-like [Physella acuta]
MGHEEEEEHHSASPQNSGNFKFQNVAMALFKVFDGQVTFVRAKVVLPIQSRNQTKYYHRRVNRVPTVCIYKADQQFHRDRVVDSDIVRILRQRKIEYYAWEGPDKKYKCQQIEEDYNQAADNWFIKYGDMRSERGALEAYMKQKHRLIWERRNPGKKITLNK